MKNITIDKLIAEMKEDYIEYINEDKLIIHSADGATIIVNGSPSIENCKKFIKILLLAKKELEQKNSSK
ncbi:hypothetical protein D3C74_137860 [compost metagenome]